MLQQDDVWGPEIKFYTYTLNAYLLLFMFLTGMCYLFLHKTKPQASLSLSWLQ